MEKTNIIFLDIDGVLNSTESMSKLSKQRKEHIDLPDKKLIDNLNYILDKTNAKIIVSSCWRYTHSEFSLDIILYLCGLQPYKVIGITPTVHMNRVRGQEIQVWIDKNKERINNFVIIDDDTDMGNLSRYLVKTNSKVGLTRDDAEKAIKILRRKKK